MDSYSINSSSSILKALRFAAMYVLSFVGLSRSSFSTSDFARVRPMFSEKAKHVFIHKSRKFTCRAVLLRY